MSADPWATGLESGSSRHPSKNVIERRDGSAPLWYRENGCSFVPDEICHTRLRQRANKSQPLRKRALAADRTTTCRPTHRAGIFNTACHSLSGPRKKLMLRSFFALLVTALVSAPLFAQPLPNGKHSDSTDRFFQLESWLPTPNAQRTASGAPGPQYWQQRADYDIDVTLDDENQRIDGSRSDRLPQSIASLASLSLDSTGPKPL